MIDDVPILDGKAGFKLTLNFDIELRLSHFTSTFFSIFFLSNFSLKSEKLL